MQKVSSKLAYRSEKEKIRDQVLASNISVEVLTHRLKDNNIMLLKKFLKYLTKFHSDCEDKSVILNKLATQLVTQEAKKAAFEKLRFDIFKALYQPQQQQKLLTPRQAISSFAQLTLTESCIEPAPEQQNIPNFQPQITTAQASPMDDNARTTNQCQIQQEQEKPIIDLLQLQKESEKEVILKQNQIDQKRVQKRSEFANIKPNMSTISYSQIKLQQQVYPFFSPAKEKDSLCVCKQFTNELKCQTCGIGYHKNCMRQCAKQKWFMCPACQLNLLDPTSIPVMYLVRPFLVKRGTLDDRQFPCSQSFRLDEPKRKFLSQTESFIIQLRCMQLNEPLVHQMPKFGAVKITHNQKFLKSQTFTTGEPPNDRKRKDKVMDLTALLCLDKKLSLEDEKFNLELNHETKHQGDNDLWYVATLLVCRKYSISDLVSFVDQLQPRIWFQNTFQKILKQRQQSADEVQVETNVFKLSLTCKFTFCPMKMAVKGQWCDHFECFDLENYLNSNSKTSDWKCPIRPSEKPIDLFLDEFMMELIKVSNRETEAEIDYEVLEVRFKHGVYKLTTSGLEIKEKRGEMLSKKNLENGTNSYSQIQIRESTDQTMHQTSQAPVQTPLVLGKRNYQQQDQNQILGNFSSYKQQRQSSQRQYVQSQQNATVDITTPFYSFNQSVTQELSSTSTQRTDQHKITQNPKEKNHVQNNFICLD